jgi:hypothetical protein
VSLLKLIFDWLVLTPAALFAYLIACLLGLIPLIGSPVAWHYTIRYFELGNDTGRPRTLSTRIMAGIAGLYAFLVLGFAVYHLPRIMFAIMKAAD